MKKIFPVRSIQGECLLDGDKSISHRLVLLSIFNRGRISISNLAGGEDVLTSLNAAQTLGVGKMKKGTEIELFQKLPPEHNYGYTEIDCGNSGTTARLLSGILCGLNGKFSLTGDTSLSNRPMARIIEPLKSMNAEISGRTGKFLPIEITGKTFLNPIIFENRKSSAQVKSAVLLAGMRANGRTTVLESVKSRDHTELLLKTAGLPVNINNDSVSIIGPQHLNFSKRFVVPGDPSSAAFLAVAAAIIPGSSIKFANLLLNPSRIAFLKILEAMGAGVVITVKNKNWETSGTVEITGGSLNPVIINQKDIPSLIDELPALAIAMAFAQGDSRVSGASELRVKETDRIGNLVSQLKLAGIQCDESKDGFVISGNREIEGGIVLDPYNDHRLAMAFSLLGLKSRNGVIIKNSHCVKISFPDFFEKLSSISKN